MVVPEAAAPIELPDHSLRANVHDSRLEPGESTTMSACFAPPPTMWGLLRAHVHITVYEDERPTVQYVLALAGYTGDMDVGDIQSRLQDELESMRSILESRASQGTLSIHLTSAGEMKQTRGSLMATQDIIPSLDEDLQEHDREFIDEIDLNASNDDIVEVVDESQVTRKSGSLDEEAETCKSRFTHTNKWSFPADSNLSLNNGRNGDFGPFHRVSC